MAGHEFISGVIARRRVLVGIEHPRGERGCRLADLLRAYEGLHGHPARDVRRIEVPETPRHLWALGELEAVVYRRPAMSRPHAHEFERPLPLLTSDPDGRTLHVVGGGFHVGDDGIED